MEQESKTEHLLKLLGAARKWVEEGGTISGYGFYRPENPHNFSPDPESCSDEEMANHKAACEAWDRGDYKAPLGSESFYDESGRLTLHITRAPWGIGSYTDIQDEAADLLERIGKAERRFGLSYRCAVEDQVQRLRNEGAL